MNELPLLDFKIRQPLDTKEKPEVMFLLHGYGSHEEDLFSFASYLPKKYLIISLRAPLSLPFGGFAWYSIHFDAQQDKWTDDEEAIDAQRILWHNITHHLNQFNLKGSKISLLGFSQGAILSWALALNQPDKINRVIALSGYVNEDIFNYSEVNLDQLKCFCSHGNQDPTIPIAWAQKSVTRLQEKGVPVVLNAYSSGHGVSPENFEDLVRWLEIN